MKSSGSRSGFTLIELVSVIAVAACVTAVLGPTLGHVRGQMRGVSSEANLAAIGQAGGMYSIDNDGRIASFTWRGGESYINLGTGQFQTATNDLSAAGMQLRDILYRATGRLSGSRRILAPNSFLVHRRYSQLVLADYMGNVGESIWAHPDDYNQLVWQQNQLNFLIVPHGRGQIPIGYEGAPGGGVASALQLWHFGSSYQTVQHAWMPDTAPTYAPIYETRSIQQVVGGQPQFGDRTVQEVAFPAHKVWMHSEYDHDQTGNPFFAYDHAAPEKLMFDGSINTMRSGDAMPSVSPASYSFGGTEVWTQPYIPMDTFPLPLGGLFDPTPLNMRYAWTLRGLGGVDYIRLLDRVKPR